MTSYIQRFNIIDFSRVVLLMTVLGIAPLALTDEQTDPANFQVNGDGTVTDLATGLQWSQCYLGQEWTAGECAGEPVRLNWRGAFTGSRAAEFAGHEDWRLPDENELRSLVYCSSGRQHGPDNTGAGQRCRGNFQVPTLPDAAFPETKPDMHWSYSPSIYLANGSLGIFFRSGGTYHRDREDLYLVRPVRDAN